METNQITRAVCVTIIQDEQTYDKFCERVKEVGVKQATDEFVEEQMKQIDYNVVAMMLSGVPLGLNPELQKGENKN